MQLPKQRDILFLLARDLAEHVLTPTFIVDAEGTLLFYNEAAEAILGAPFAEVGELGPSEWGKMWNPEDLEGNAIPAARLPLSVAFREKRSVHAPMWITTPDGTRRHIEVTAFPLIAKDGKAVGAVAIFWEERRRLRR